MVVGGNAWIAKEQERRSVARRGWLKNDSGGRREEGDGARLREMSRGGGKILDLCY